VCFRERERGGERESYGEHEGRDRGRRCEIWRESVCVGEIERERGVTERLREGMTEREIKRVEGWRERKREREKERERERRRE
jgi:hypothetical protein